MTTIESVKLWTKSDHKALGASCFFLLSEKRGKLGLVATCTEHSVTRRPLYKDTLNALSTMRQCMISKCGNYVHQRIVTRCQTLEKYIYLSSSQYLLLRWVPPTVVQHAYCYAQSVTYFEDDILSFLNFHLFFSDQRYSIHTQVGLRSAEQITYNFTRDIDLGLI